MVESLETRLGSQVQKLSDHRPLLMHRGVLKSQISTSCRMGDSLVVGQICIKNSEKTVIKKQVDFEVKLTLPRDVLGFVRRDTQEDKEA